MTAPVAKMTREEKLAFAEKLVALLRVLNRPPRRIRTTNGWTDNHALLRARARVELGIEFGLPGAPWKIYNEQHRSIGERYIRTCPVCGKPFVVKRRGDETCSGRCANRRWRQRNPDKVRALKRAHMARARSKDPDKYNARAASWYAMNRESILQDAVHADHAERPCRFCEEPFKPPRSDSFFCSPRCSRRHSRGFMKPVLRNCERCDAAFVQTRRSRRFCSAACRKASESHSRSQGARATLLARSAKHREINREKLREKNRAYKARKREERMRAPSERCRGVADNG